MLKNSYACFGIGIYIISLRVELIKSFTSTSKRNAILSSVWRSGWDVFVHHFETVVTFLPSCSANHLLVLFFSAKTTLSRFKSFIVSNLYVLNANIVIFCQKEDLYSTFLCIFDELSSQKAKSYHYRYKKGTYIMRKVYMFSLWSMYTSIHVLIYILTHVYNNNEYTRLHIYKYTYIHIYKAMFLVF